MSGGILKKEIIILSAILILAVLCVAAAADAPKAKIKTIGLLGRGLMISPSDPKVFMIAKIGLADVEVDTDGNISEQKIGIFFADNQSYRIRDVSIGDGESSGSLYRNGTKVGSFDVTSVMKGDVEIWVGTLVLDGNTWNLYILEAERAFKITEVAEKISEFCQGNPERCNGIGPTVCGDANSSSCRLKIANWCESHPSDQRCTALLNNYCKSNLDDGRCRQELKEFCANNTDDEKCRTLELKTSEQYCLKFPLDKGCIQMIRNRTVDFCLNNPNENVCIGLRNATEFVQRAKMAIYCKAHPSESKCQDFCDANPMACSRPPEISAEVGAKQTSKVKI
jgi:hypothetical protein